MKIGIDIGATKIESVILKKNGDEIERSRIPCPKSYKKIIKDVSKIVFSLDRKYKKKFQVGVCHPGSIDYKTGLLKNSVNAKQLNNKKLKVKLKLISEKINSVPVEKNIHKTISKILNARKESVEKGTGIDWSSAEALAFGSLLVEGYPVRLVGQDSGRGTFSQRHSVLRNQVDNSRYIPLNNISKKYMY